MTVTTIFYTRLNQQTTSTQGMPGMKTMMYMMPVMFLFILNSYPAGLSYYYFLANLITIGQTYLIRSFVDENKIRAQLQANKKKPAKNRIFKNAWRTWPNNAVCKCQKNNKSDQNLTIYTLLIISGVFLLFDLTNSIYLFIQKVD